jgi:hypothetical protein
LRGAISQDAKTSEERAWCAIVFVQDPSDLLILRTAGYAGAEVICEAAATDLAQGIDISAIDDQKNWLIDCAKLEVI